jgi:hypothetical protein
MNAFSRHDSGDQSKKLRRLNIPGASAFGAPSAWLFLVRLHACRAGLRFTRHCSLDHAGRQGDGWQPFPDPRRFAHD